MVFYLYFHLVLILPFCPALVLPFCPAFVLSFCLVLTLPFFFDGILGQLVSKSNQDTEITLLVNDNKRFTHLHSFVGSPET